MIRAAHIALCFALLILSGCGASRRVMKANTETVSETAATLQTQAATTLSEKTATHTDLSKDEEIVTEVVEFDTARPVDPATGAPPVKRKITQTRRVDTKTRQVTKTETEAADSVSLRVEATEKESAATHTKEEARRGMNWMQRILCFTGATAIITLAVWLVWRRFKCR